MILPEAHFRDEEYAKPRRYFELQGYQVETASTTMEPIRGTISLTLLADKKLSEVNSEDYVALFLVGGLGTARYQENRALHTLLREAAKDKKVIAGTSFAPVVLAKALLLSGKPATCITSDRSLLIQLGALYTGRKVEIADNIVTADGHLAALPAARAVVALLKEGKAEPVENPLLHQEVTALG